MKDISSSNFLNSFNLLAGNVSNNFATPASPLNQEYLYCHCIALAINLGNGITKLVPGNFSKKSTPPANALLPIRSNPPAISLDAGSVGSIRLGNLANVNVKASSLACFIILLGTTFILSKARKDSKVLDLSFPVGSTKPAFTNCVSTLLTKKALLKKASCAVLNILTFLARLLILASPVSCKDVSNNFLVVSSSFSISSNCCINLFCPLGVKSLYKPAVS